MGKIDWKLGMTSAQMKQTVSLNTEVVFKWSGFHNVYELPDKKAFDACDFSKAKALASHNQGPFNYKASSAGIVYFACKVGGHCSSKQKRALTVTGGKGSICQPCTSNLECGKDSFCCPNQKLCIPSAHSNCLCPNEDSAASKHSNNDRVNDKHKCGSKACYFCPSKSSGQQNLRLSKSEQKRQKKAAVAKRRRRPPKRKRRNKAAAAKKKKVAAAKKKKAAAAKKKAAADKKKQNKVAAAKKKKEAAAEKKRAAKKKTAEAKKKKKQEKKSKKKGKKKGKKKNGGR